MKIKGGNKMVAFCCGFIIRQVALDPVFIFFKMTVDNLQLVVPFNYSQGKLFLVS